MPSSLFVSKKTTDERKGRSLSMISSTLPKKKGKKKTHKKRDLKLKKESDEIIGKRKPESFTPKNKTTLRTKKKRSQRRSYDDDDFYE